MMLLYGTKQKMYQQPNFHIRRQYNQTMTENTTARLISIAYKSVEDIYVNYAIQI